MSTIQELENTLNTIGQELMGMSNWLDKHTRILNAFSGQESEIKQTQSMKQTLIKMNEVLDKHQEELQKIQEQLSSIDENIEANLKVFRLYFIAQEVIGETKEKEASFSKYLQVFLDMIARIEAGLAEEKLKLANADNNIAEISAASPNKSLNQHVQEMFGIQSLYSKTVEEYLDSYFTSLTLENVPAEIRDDISKEKVKNDLVYGDLLELYRKQIGIKVINCFNDHVRRSLVSSEYAAMFNFLSAYHYKLTDAEHDLADSSAVVQIKSLVKLFSLIISGDSNHRSIVFNEMCKMNKEKTPAENEELYNTVFALLKDLPNPNMQERLTAPVGYGTTFPRPITPPALGIHLVLENDIIAQTRMR